MNCTTTTRCPRGREQQRENETAGHEVINPDASAAAEFMPIGGRKNWKLSRSRIQDMKKWRGRKGKTWEKTGLIGNSWRRDMFGFRRKYSTGEFRVSGASWNWSTFTVDRNTIVTRLISRPWNLVDSGQWLMKCWLIIFARTAHMPSM